MSVELQVHLIIQWGADDQCCRPDPLCPVLLTNIPVALTLHSGAVWGRGGGVAAVPMPCCSICGGAVKWENAHLRLFAWRHGAGRGWLQTLPQSRTPNPEPCLCRWSCRLCPPPLYVLSLCFPPSPCPSHFPALTPPVSAVYSARRAGRPRSRPWRRRSTSSTTPPPIRFSPPWRRRAAPCSSYRATRAKPLISSTRSEFAWENNTCESICLFVDWPKIVRNQESVCRKIF